MLDYGASGGCGSCSKMSTAATVGWILFFVGGLVAGGIVIWYFGLRASSYGTVYTQFKKTSASLHASRRHVAEAGHFNLAATYAPTPPDGDTTPDRYNLRLIAMYLAEDIDPVTQNNVGNTVIVFLNPGCGGNINDCTGKPLDWFDFTDVTIVNNLLNSQPAQVTPGTYRYVRMEFRNTITVSTWKNIQFQYGNSSLFDVAGQNGAVTSAPSNPPVIVTSSTRVVVSLSYTLQNLIKHSSQPHSGNSAGSCTEDGNSSGYWCLLGGGYPIFTPSFVAFNATARSG